MTEEEIQYGLDFRGLDNFFRFKRKPMPVEAQEEDELFEIKHRTLDGEKHLILA